MSRELIKRYKRRSITVRKGDTVKVMRGQFKGKEGKVEEVADGRLRLDCAKMKKADGSEIRYTIHPSKVMIVKAEVSDPKRKIEVKANAH